MCLICTEWAKGNLKVKEAERNALEMSDGATDEEKRHLFDTVTRIKLEEFELWRKSREEQLKSKS